MKTKLNLIAAIPFALLTALLLCAGCAGLFKSIITVTEIRNSVMNELGALHRAGKIDAATDAKIAAADRAYLAAAEAAEVTLKAYRDTKTGDPQAALVAVKNAVLSLIDILATYQSAELPRQQLAKATKL